MKAISAICLWVFLYVIRFVLEVSSLGLKRQERQADHSRPHSIVIKNVWGCKSRVPPQRHGLNRDNVTTVLPSFM